MTTNSLDTLFRTEFPLEQHLIHLNHAAVGPWPMRSVYAIKRFSDENMYLGSQNYLNWLKTENQLRLRLSKLINAASVSEIALSKNTSEALSIVAYGLDWSPGDEVVITNQEFPSNRIVWESLQDRFGVVVKVTDLNTAEDPESAILKCLSQRTRLVSVSSIQYGTGLKLDLTLLGNEIKSRNILFCVDAIQSVGACKVDVQRDKIDFLMADGHKWMLGPEGLALFFVKKDALNSLKLNQFGWHMVKDRGNFDRHDWEPADTAIRFECGSPNMLATHALNESVGLLLEVGIEVVEDLVKNKVKTLADHLQAIPGISLVTDLANSRYAGILTFRHSSRDSRHLFDTLNSLDVLCAARGGGIRFSPHFYTPDEKLAAACERLETALR
ncbi:class V aminotransferase [Hahella sp. CCB-MM4]|uniref:aminotransferase class V-fold PLP-dependent enzyme n=1 Tax=Hahella sp. (strain CCB-MM4) TaxID=1926491 RepID=UPI000B9C21EF|nr:aminotransferase class V-fold PLP-dependent enzyme [Hahella sp. CCB-MM4]OZG73391.1 class V aminotransferase [Hahella sp. CCB-MM4]